MGFGSYDESEQEQDTEGYEDKGLCRTAEVKRWRMAGKRFEGEATTEMGDEEKLFENL